MYSGTYHGDEERFLGRRAIIRYISDAIVQAQFNEGAMWETHSWITFTAKDWSIYEIPEVE